MIKELCLLAAGGAMGMLVRSEYERSQLAVEEFVIHSNKIKQPRTLLFLSDLHNREFGIQNQKLLAAVDHVQPDAVLIGGDTMVTKPDDRQGLTITRQLVTALTARYPVYYANGNHEQRLVWEKERYGDRYRQLKALLKAAGVMHLSDSTACLGEDIRISGLNIEEQYYEKFRHPFFDASYIETRLGSADTSKFQILLAHSPMFFDAYAAWNADLTLAGHFHGGTIRLPFLGGVMTPQYQFFLPLCAGEFFKGESRLIVSRGLGTHSVNIRLNNKPQVVVMRLQPDSVTQ